MSKKGEWPEGKMGTMNRTYRYRLYPTRRQVAALEGQLAFACDLYNAALQQRRDAWRFHRTSIHLSEQQHQLTEARRDGPEMNYTAQEMVLQRLNLAFDAFFRRLRSGAPGFPRFKPKARFNTLSWRIGHGGAAIANDRLRIQGVGHIKVKWHRELQGEVRQTRITRRNGRWYVAFTVRMEKPDSLSAAGEEVGLDLGLVDFATLSTGETAPARARADVRPERRVARKVNRRKLGSKRRRKAGTELGRLRERRANRSRDAAHKLARSLVERYDLIAVEDLPVRNMVRGWRSMNREIHRQGWAQFLAILDDKAESAGRQVVRVNPRYTSQHCHECGVVDSRSRQRKAFICTGCGHKDDADVNAARNILALARGTIGSDGAIRRKPQSNGGLPEKPLAESSHQRRSCA